MAAGLSLTVLMTPIVIAVTTVATLIAIRGARAPRRMSDELGYQPDPASSLSLTLTRYVGGHPAVGLPLPSPFVLLTPEHVAVFARRWGTLLFKIGWSHVQDLALLDRAQMDMALGSVRGLSRGAVEAALPDARFVRLRFEDDRGWWQNVVFELSGTLGVQQFDELQRHWARVKAGGLAAAEPPIDAPPQAAAG